MRMLCLMVLTAVVCAPHDARAEIVHFTNPAPGQPGHYAWYGFMEFIYLDIMFSAEEQTNQPSGSSVVQVVIGYPTGGIWGLLGFFDGLSDSAMIAGVHVPPYDDPFVLPLQHGDSLIGLDFLDWGIYAAGYPPNSVSSFPEGALRYVGVLTRDGRHGWIAVERTGLNFNAAAWAYQTQPGEPIIAGQIPSPGAAALLTLSSFVCARRRRS